MTKAGILIITAIVLVIGGVVAVLVFTPGFGVIDIVLIVFVILFIIFGVLFFLSRWSAKKQSEHSDLIESSKQLADIYVIDKKREKPANANLPKAVMDNMPRMAKMMKLNLVKVKVGKQIATLICEKKWFDVLQLKKNFKVELAGLYIVSVKGVKTEDDKKREAAERKRKEKADKAAQKLLTRGIDKK